MRAYGAPALRRIDRWMGPDDGVDVGRAQAVTKANRDALRAVDKAAKAGFSMCCAPHGWHRNHARKALKQALRRGS